MQPEDDDHHGGTRRNQRPRNNFSVSKPETGWPGAGTPAPGLCVGLQSGGRSTGPVPPKCRSPNREVISSALLTRFPPLALVPFRLVAERNEKPFFVDGDVMDARLRILPA